jgi:hypothetical protein
MKQRPTPLKLDDDALSLPAIAQRVAGVHLPQVRVVRAPTVRITNEIHQLYKHFHGFWHIVRHTSDLR